VRASLLVAAAALALACSDPSRVEPPETPSAPEGKGPAVFDIEIAGPHDPRAMRHYVARIAQRIQNQCWPPRLEAAIRAAVDRRGFVIEVRVDGGNPRFRRCAEYVVAHYRLPGSRGTSVIAATARFGPETAPPE
jgi:hypothetical protein